MNALDITALVLVIVGAVNWGLVGLFDFNLVAAIFGTFTLVTRIIYILVGVAGLYAIWTAVKAGQTAREIKPGARRV